MKKTLKTLLLVLLVVIMTGCFNDNNDALKFKKEYEALNGVENANGSAKYIDINISKENQVVYASYDDVFNLLKDGTGVILFGFPECPWCRNAIPELLSAATETSLDKIYYLNNKEDRDVLSLGTDGKIIVEKEANSNYKKLVELLSDNLGSYEGLNDESIKRLYFPTVVFIKDGKVIYLHVSTVESHKNKGDGNMLMTDKEKEELQLIYINAINKVLGNSCDEKC